MERHVLFFGHDKIEVSMKYDLSLITSSRFCYQDVMKSFDLDYEETASVLSGWEEAGLIRPIRSSGRVAFTPSFYARYQKIRTVKDRTAEKERILQLHPSLIGFYLSHLADYEKMEPEILKLSRVPGNISNSGILLRSRLPGICTPAICRLIRH